LIASSTIDTLYAFKPLSFNFSISSSLVIFNVLVLKYILGFSLLASIKSSVKSFPKLLIKFFTIQGLYEYLVDKYIISSFSISTFNISSLFLIIFLSIAFTNPLDFLSYFLTKLTVSFTAA